MKNYQIVIGIIVGLIVGAILGASLHSSNSNSIFGSTSCGSITCLSGGLRLVTDAGGDFESDVAAVFSGAFKVGASGTNYTLIKSGTCTLTSDTSINATSTGSYTCATTGSLAGDLVRIGPLATTTTKMSAQYVIQNTVVAGTDTTTGTILNLTGAAGVPGGVNGYGSSTPYQIFR